MGLKKLQFTILLLAFALMPVSVIKAVEMQWYDGVNPVTLYVATKSSPVLDTAIEMFMSDMEAVTGQRARLGKSKDASIAIYQLDNISKKMRKILKNGSVPVERLDSLYDGFDIRVIEGKITVTGKNGRGAAYGLLELSRMAGVSPWIWWGDVVPQSRGSLAIDTDFNSTQGASVEFRGIFLNDEDWSLRPWSCSTFEPGESGIIGPKAYKEIFKLLIRLRANAVWPAMHPGTRAFFKDPANKLMADSCGIAVGSSHCEPMLRNNVGEWDVSERGPFNYITNRQAVQDYWTERLEEVRNSSGGNMFTIGMRGIHDGSMEGVKTKEEKLSALQQVIDDQQLLIDKHIGNAKGQMQVFVPYKEVLELYESGLDVPDHVTLMWCDDNYGYMTRLSDMDEQSRSGGGGVYYHLSYWGRPHDYLWLTTTQPGLIYNEMLNAYNHNVRKLWIANVHDPKVAAYDMELFLDLAWNIDCVSSDDVGSHLEQWLVTNFGKEVAVKLYPAMREFYRLCAIRRPEFMGWNQVELNKNIFNRGLGPVANTEFSFSEFGNEADRYMTSYNDILQQVEETETLIPDRLKDAYFAAIKYPVAAAANNAVKMLEAQMARSIASGSTSVDMAANIAEIFKSVAKSQNAYQNIRSLTAFYNDTLAGGKWRRSMNMHPRDLPALSAPVLPTLLTDAEVDVWLNEAPRGKKSPYKCPDGYIARNADSFDMSSGAHHVVDMLGHSNRSLELAKGASVSYVFYIDDTIHTPTLTIATIPTQPNDKGNLRYRVTVDGRHSYDLDLKEPFRSEQWKLNVLRAQALRNIGLPPLAPGEHILKIEATDPHIIIDQWCVDGKPGRKYYVIPASSE